MRDYKSQHVKPLNFPIDLLCTHAGLRKLPRRLGQPSSPRFHAELSRAVQARGFLSLTQQPRSLRHHAFRIMEPLSWLPPVSADSSTSLGTIPRLAPWHSHHGSVGLTIGRGGLVACFRGLQQYKHRLHRMRVATKVPAMLHKLQSCCALSSRHWSQTHRS